jgi:hypothetical protein
LDKVKENYSAGKIFMVLYNETADEVRGVIKCINSDQSKKVAEILGVKMIGDICEFSEQSSDTKEAGQRIIERLRAGLIVK